MDWRLVFLFLHVMGAIIAFGPTYAFPIIGGMGGKEPQQENFATRVTEMIVEQRVLPLAIFQGITGIALILVTGINLLATRWLLLGIVLYLIVLGYTQTQTTEDLSDRSEARLFEARLREADAPTCARPS